MKKFCLLNLLLLGTTLMGYSDTTTKSYPDVRFSDRFVRIELAGSRINPSLQTSETVNFRQKRWIKYDPKSHYYLELADDGAGKISSLSLTLSPNSKRLVYGEGIDDEPVQKAQLPRLTNGTGVNIGDSPQKVVSKLGTMPQEDNYNRKTKIRTYIYRAPILLRLTKWDGKRNTFYWVKWEYEADYEFHNGKLWSIAYDVNEPYNGE